MADADIRRGPYYEYSVVYTDRVYNMMSPPFQTCMRDISSGLKKAYNAKACVLIPGSGTFAMEAVGRQFGYKKKVLIIRNGYFSYRWSDIFNVCEIPSEETVINASPVKGQEKEKQPQFAPCPIEDVVEAIKKNKPDAVFAPHVETSTGILLSDDYIRKLADATHSVGGALVIDGIAAGNVWCDMEKNDVDAYVSAPQKGWTGPCCVGIVMLRERGIKLTRENKPSSFCCNLQQWLDVMEKYENVDGTSPGFRYYTTLPTDALMKFAEVIKEAEARGLDKLKEQMFELGTKVRAELAKRGYKSVAADGWASPGVVVVYSPIAGMVGKFKEQGLQTAGGVPWKIGEEAYGVDSKASTFRVGLFGFDKTKDIELTVKRLTDAIDKIKA